MSTRNKVCTKSITETGHVEFAFANQETRTIDPASFPEPMQTRAMQHGFAQKFGDAYANVAGNVSDAVEKFDTLFEVVMNGEWTQGRSGDVGPRPSMVVDAIVAAKQVAGYEPTEADIEGYREKVKADRKAVLAIPQVNVEYVRIQQERAKARLAEARKNAKGAEADALATL